MLAHVAGELLEVLGQGFIRIGGWQRHADLPQLATLQQGKSLAFGQADHVGGLDHRHAGGADAVLCIGGEVGRPAHIRAVGGAADQCRGVDVHVGQLAGEQLGSRGLAHPQHEQVVEVADDLARFRPAADTRLNVAERLGVGRDL
ncbi:hypothetical protein D9M68_755150 [compost metagenome]